MRDLLMQHDGKLETCPFRGPWFIKKNSSREQLLQKNHKNGSHPKDSNKNTDTSNTYTPQATIDRHGQKLNSVLFEDPYDNINPIYNIHEDTNLIDTQEKNL